MQKTAQISISDYDYPLAEERIAKYPLPQRDQSKLLLYKQGTISEDRFCNLADHLPVGTFLVCNNTQVIRARLRFRKESGAQIEVFCLEPHTPHSYISSFESQEGCTWQVLIGNAKRWKSGTLSQVIEIRGKQITLFADRVEQAGATPLVRFSWNDSTLSFAELLEAVGELPIPPYLHRKTEASDLERYQTIYSHDKGSVAAPTAGLHFTEKVFEALAQKGIVPHYVTLHVGAGTFKPVQSPTIGEHEMHAEYISVERSFLEELKGSLGKVVAVGTTSVRTLESLYFIGEQLHRHPQSNGSDLEVDQWRPYAKEYTLTAAEALQAIIDYLDRTGAPRLISSTRIIIAPGYTFRIVKGLITNFHQPKSTLLLLVSAFTRGTWRELYAFALKNDFRFLSYGDSSLLLPE